MALTDRGISNLKPQAKDAFTADVGGLYLRVQPSGTKTFMYRSRTGGSARWVTLGNYPSLSLADARQKARELKTGMLPSQITVQTVYDDWIVRSIKKHYKSPLQVEQRMGKHVLPEFGTLAIGSIKRADLSKKLNEIADTAPVQGNRVLTDVKLLFSYAVERGWLEASPAERITQRTVGGAEKTRDRVLTNAELVELIGVLRRNYSKARDTETGFDAATRYALALLLLTGQRSGELRQFEKKQLKGAVWAIPPEITKTDVPMNVHLGPLTRRVVKAALKELGSVPFKGMEGQTLSHATRYMKLTPSFTPHDLRRSMATHMGDLGVEVYIVEKCLNHTLGGVLAIYNRSEYADKKKAAWRLWERHLLRLVREAKKSPPVIAQ